MPINKKPPSGYIIRDAHKRKAYIRRDGTRVKAALIPATYTPSRGVPGKAPPSRRILPPVENTRMLRNFGYSVYTSPSKRRAAINKAIKKYKSSLYVERHLTLIKNYTPKDEPAYKMLAEDVKYLQAKRSKKKLTGR